MAKNRLTKDEIMSKLFDAGVTGERVWLGVYRNKARIATRNEANAILFECQWRGLMMTFRSIPPTDAMEFVDENWDRRIK